MNRFIKTAVAAVAAVGLGLGLTACGSSSSSDDGLTKVTFMNYWTPDTNHIGVYVADQLGYYRDEGLDVDIVAVSTAGGEQAVSTGVADFALSTLTNVSMFDAQGGDLEMVMQVQQEPSAIWCALASNTSITRPKDFDGKTFATFGSSESDAVVKKMIQTDGGTGDYDKVTVGTSTFQALTSGRADFGGFYSTWEGVEADLYGPTLNCFAEQDYGVPGNADSIGIITADSTVQNDPELVQKFVTATQKGYMYAYEHPDEAAELLVKAAPEADLDIDLVKKSMQVIVDGNYWGDVSAVKDGSFTLGTVDTKSTQEYFDFLAAAGAYEDANGTVLTTAPQSTDMSTNEFVK
ncbi:ABC transporter substrate-binding protein [Bifidobacterium choloepi]|uniref:Thiamine pyrimidine synthase n=1 Tax=Bifidobacterium choloepi TaxID=2614131 RepID=A0A6I5NHB2_9BIFI|nr:ABC transporter substrate-binding protein [Bifidobacterium choloepi]NEG70604.1 ABC transporter substrate-binding protein [Bifidobacterium choloepi]